MMNMNIINMEELENVVGGTNIENLKMVLYLQAITDEPFYIINGNNDPIDYEKMIRYFRSKGYGIWTGLYRISDKKRRVLTDDSETVYRSRH